MSDEIISIYSKEDAIADGILFEAGQLNGRGIVFTAHLLDELSKEELLAVLVRGLAEAEKLTEPDIRKIEIGGKRLWLDYCNGDLTFMFPEDY